MTWWRRKKKQAGQKQTGQKQAPVVVSVFDPGAVTGSFQRPGLTVGGRRLPPIIAPSITDQTAAQTRRMFPAGTGPVDVGSSHRTHAEAGSVVYMGLGGRAAVVVELTRDQRRNLYDLGEAIEDNGASLYLDAHPGFLRASLALPSMDIDLDTAMLVGAGDVQEFLAAAHATETVELHIYHATHDRLLPFTCAAPGLREVLEAGLDLITLPAPADLRGALMAVNDSLNPAAHIPLRVTGRAELTIALDVDV
ncbi:hypothetical protein QQY66_21060 [Streptomyces sp. DG2A-72]|uniref:hypothetical protein n=1 Tax=Streptomyces sp. DG2A-72 TaxID=3051386 RepID=UPI00265BE3F0|nr:hypothetical protein [Streptomyces sp. DG2A-72]MDO0934058.1 hypothetical protein [Streptomyces sp. DG2A-72]